MTSTAADPNGRQTEIRKVYEERDLPSALSPGEETRPYMDFYLPDNKAARILDAGCGAGRWSLYLVERGYTNIDAVDLFEERELPGVRYRTSSLDALPFEDGAFDFCFSLSVIYYLESPQRALEEMYRVLRPGSVLLVTVHTKYSLYTAIRRLKRLMGAKSVEHLKYCKFESAAAYRRYAKAAGFQMLRTDGFRTVSSSLYRKAGKLLGAIGVRLKDRHPQMTRSTFLSGYKAWFAYHAVIVLQKPKAAAP